MNKLEQQAKKIIEIRAFEETILSLFSQNKLSGTTHTYIGQEATAVGIMEHVSEDDKIFSNHRCHGHYLAYGGEAKALLAEIMSKESGLCQGRGGSQHIHYKNFFSNGVQGGIVPNAVGIAWADKLSGRNGITVVFIGDGTLGQGIIYESFNMAALHDCPVLFVVEDNSYAMSTPRTSAVSGDIADRIRGFGIETSEITSNDVEELDACFEKAFQYVRNNKKPFCQVVHNYRLAAHSKGDDFRDPQEIAEWKEKDPIRIIEKKLSKTICEQYRKEADNKLADIIEQLEKENCISIPDYTQKYISDTTRKQQTELYSASDYLNTENDKVLTAINHALNDSMAHDSSMIILGEDIRDPYGGAFRVTKGLSLEYSDRVINTPISEPAIAGICVGLAMNKMFPIMEIMFGDFISLCFDQILNHGCKYGWVYGDDVQVPVIFRLPSGGGRGYGPTHSQSLEKYLTGIPMLTVIALTQFLNVEKQYKNAIAHCNSPMVIVENKKMYGERIKVCQDNMIGNFCVSLSNNCISPTLRLSLDENTKPDAVIITYGGMSALAVESAEKLMLEEEIQVDVIILTQLAPLPLEDLKELIDKNTCVGTLEEGNYSGGIGAQIISALAEHDIGKKYFRIASMDVPVPNGVVLENQILPDVNKITEKIISTLND